MSTSSHSPKHLIPLLVAVSILFLLLVVIAVGVVIYLEKHLQSTVNQTPHYTSAQLYDKAVQQIDQGGYPVAESYLEQALSKQDDATYRGQLAVVKYRLKKYNESIAEYQKLVDQKKDVAFAENGIGNAYRDWAATDATHKAGYLQQAESAYHQSIAADPQYVAAYSNLALLLQSENRLADATTVLQQGISVTKRPELSQLLQTITKK